MAEDRIAILEENISAQRDWLAFHRRNRDQEELRISQCLGRLHDLSEKLRRETEAKAYWGAKKGGLLAPTFDLRPRYKRFECPEGVIARYPAAHIGNCDLSDPAFRAKMATLGNFHIGGCYASKEDDAFVVVALVNPHKAMILGRGETVDAAWIDTLRDVQ